MGVVMSLTPGTTYVVTVAGVNGAMRDGGVGMASDPAHAETLSGKLLISLIECNFGCVGLN